jgi:hypothetical protein
MYFICTILFVSFTPEWYNDSKATIFNIDMAFRSKVHFRQSPQPEAYSILELLGN